jgi:hypothetical protein
MITLHNKMADLRIRYDEAVTDAKESGEKLAAFIERGHRDQRGGLEGEEGAQRAIAAFEIASCQS